MPEFDITLSADQNLQLLYFLGMSWEKTKFSFGEFAQDPAQAFIQLGSKCFYKLKLAVKEHSGKKCLQLQVVYPLISGLRETFWGKLAQKRKNWNLFQSRNFEYCTDNAAMIAMAATLQNTSKGEFSSLGSDSSCLNEALRHDKDFQNWLRLSNIKNKKSKLQILEFVDTYKKAGNCVL